MVADEEIWTWAPLRAETPNVEEDPETTPDMATYAPAWASNPMPPVDVMASLVRDAPAAWAGVERPTTTAGAVPVLVTTEVVRRSAPAAVSTRRQPVELEDWPLTNTPAHW